MPSNACIVSALELVSVGHWQRHIGGKALEQGVGGRVVGGWHICMASAVMPWCSGRLVARWRGIGSNVGIGVLFGGQSGCALAGLWWVGVRARCWQGRVVRGISDGGAMALSGHWFRCAGVASQTRVCRVLNKYG